MRPLSFALPVLMLSAALCVTPVFRSGQAQAGGYGAFDWGERLKSVTKKLDGRRFTPRTDLETVTLETRVLRGERDEKVRLARLKKKPASEVRRLQRVKPAKTRLSAGFYWLELGPLEAKVVLHFLDERLTSAEVNVLFEAHQRAAAAELLDLLQAKYGAPKAHRGADSPGAPAVDLFDGGDTDVEAYQQPVHDGRSGFLRLIYRSKERRDTVLTYLGDLEARWRALQEARHPPGPSAAERDTQRKADLMQHL